jgi:hypothetical protein
MTIGFSAVPEQLIRIVPLEICRPLARTMRSPGEAFEIASSRLGREETLTTVAERDCHPEARIKSKAAEW